MSIFWEIVSSPLSTHLCGYIFKILIYIHGKVILFVQYDKVRKQIHIIFRRGTTIMF